MRTSCAKSSEKNYRLSIRKYEKEHSRNIDNFTCYGSNNARDKKNLSIIVVNLKREIYPKVL